MRNGANSASGTVGTPRRLWPWLALAAVVALYAATVVLIRPAANFGSLQDDAMYFAAAKALAAGQGYTLPSFPGGLAHLKYPALFPSLLSPIWRWDPSFPANVGWGMGLSVFFGCLFLAECFLVARRTLGLGTWSSLALAALCAFNFFTLLLGGSVLSDLPFGVLLLAATLAADRSLEPGGHWAWMALAGVLAGLSTGLRTLGIGVVAGIALVALVRGSRGRAALACLAGGALSLPWILPPILQLFARHAAPESGSLGWTQTLAFYSSYIGQWRHFVPDAATQRAVLLKNFLSVILEPGIFLLFPLAGRGAFFSVLGSATALGAWAGIALDVRQAGWRSIHGVFLLYLAMVLPWPFPPQRFLVPFLPLLSGGFLVIFRQLARQAARAYRRPAPPGARTGAACLSVILLGVAVAIAANGAFIAPRLLAKLAGNQRSLLAEERQAYRWIAGHAPAQARFIAYDDVLLYLYTGRQAIRPIAPSTAAAYDDNPAIARRDAGHLADVAHHIGASYWLVSSSDFDKELGNDPAILFQRENLILAPLPERFRSENGRVRIYDLHCFQNPASGDCPPTPATPGR